VHCFCGAPVPPPSATVNISWNFSAVQFTISSDFHNVRLDRFLRKKYQDISLSRIFGMIRKGRVRINGKRKKQNYRLQEHDVVVVQTRTPPSAEKTLLQLSSDEKKRAARFIVHEDPDLLLCNKPPGLVMHRGSGHDHGLVEMMQAYLDNPGFTFVHRIDRATSGLVLGAKHPAAARKLSALLRQKAVKKYYLVQVIGRVAEDRFTLSSFLKKEETGVVEHDNDRDGARMAISKFTVLARDAGSTLLQARLLTGRTHQLRVQLARLGHPIVGDHKYGLGKEKNMLLFSRRLVITVLNLDVSLAAPDFFPLSAPNKAISLPDTTL
jgi:23S rRNA pseudouridine955/2504/2580 synthase